MNNEQKQEEKRQSTSSNFVRLSRELTLCLRKIHNINYLYPANILDRASQYLLANEFNCKCVLFDKLAKTEFLILAGFFQKER